MTKFAFIAVFICFTQLVNSQDFKFGEVSIEELEETSLSFDKTAHAAILYQNQNTYLISNMSGAHLITEIHKRIKIYDKEGFDHVTEEISLYKSGSSQEDISKLKAYTYNLEDGKIVKTELDKDQIFENEVNKNYDQVKFTMPNVREGSVIEFQYKFRSPFIWNIDEFRFQYEIPIKHLRAEIRTPEGFKFNQTQKGFIRFSPEQSYKMDHRLGMNVNIYEYKLDNVPGLKEENYVDNINNYRSGVMFELVSIKLDNGTNRSYAQSWSDVAKTIGNTDDYKNELDKTRVFHEELDQLLSGESDDIKKMKLVFSYVKQNLQWNGRDGKYFDNGIKKTIKEKKGNAADINLTLVAMLRYAGLKANPVIISTKDNAIPFFPTVDRLNYVLAYVNIEDNQYFLDGTDDFSDINTLPIRDYNWQGILVDSENMIWKIIDIKEPEQCQNMYSMKATLNEDGELQGEFRARYTKHGAYQFRRNFVSKNLEAYISDHETKHDGIEISNYEAQNTNNYEGYVTESFDFNHENSSDIINEKIYIRPMNFLRLQSNPFVEDSREYPIDFGYPSKETYNITIEIPEGYEVESMPDPTIIQLPNNLGGFKYLLDYQNRQIQLSINFEIAKAMISAENFEFLKEYFNQVVIKESEQIILKKS